MSIVAESGAEALRILDRSPHEPPLIIADIHMPEMDGFQLTAEIKRRARPSTIVMLTSGSLPEDVARCRELGVDAYLIKPVRQTELFQTIQRVLLEHEAERVPDLAVDA